MSLHDCYDHQLGIQVFTVYIGLLLFSFIDYTYECWSQFSKLFVFDTLKSMCDKDLNNVQSFVTFGFYSSLVCLLLSYTISFPYLSLIFIPITPYPSTYLFCFTVSIEFYWNGYNANFVYKCDNLEVFINLH